MHPFNYESLQVFRKIHLINEASPFSLKGDLSWVRKGGRLFICLMMESLWVVDRDVSTAILLVFIRR